MKMLIMSFLFTLLMGVFISAFGWLLVYAAQDIWKHVREHWDMTPIRQVCQQRGCVHLSDGEYVYERGCWHAWWYTVKFVICYLLGNAREDSTSEVELAWWDFHEYQCDAGSGHAWTSAAVSVNGWTYRVYDDASI